MATQRLLMLVINLLGGVAVLGSYAQGIGSRADASVIIWGGVPEALKPIYTVSMLTAAVGYLAFTGYLFFTVNPDEARVAGFGIGLFNVIYLLILINSALWMPLTLHYADHPSRALWLSIRLVLALVGVGSLALIASLWLLRGAPEGAFRWAALVGAVAFAVQTALLDALVWPAYFPVR